MISDSSAEWTAVIKTNERMVAVQSIISLFKMKTYDTAIPTVRIKRYNHENFYSKNKEILS